MNELATTLTWPQSQSRHYYTAPDGQINPVIQPTDTHLTYRTIEERSHVSKGKFRNVALLYGLNDGNCYFNVE
jgi:hypothetical protein